MTNISGTPFHVTGKFFRSARPFDEEWTARPAIDQIDDLLEILRESPIRIDVFSVCQRVPDTEPRFAHYHEMDNLAVIEVTTFDEWWKEAISRKVRQDINRASKRGLELGVTAFDDPLVDAITAIYNETPVRQGRKYWHYGKDREQTRTENATYLDRSTFLTARYDGDIVGYCKLVSLDETARMMAIVSMNAHRDKLPTNALVAEAVRFCERIGKRFLIYGEYEYIGHTRSTLTDFKRRMGFRKIEYPRYYVPLTLRGRIYLALRLHHGWKAWVPDFLVGVIRAARKKWFTRKKRAKG